jgi:3-deoxy-7-phosphoheptulonate synthase
MSERWTPESWRAKPVQQMPEYPDQAALKAVEQQLAGFPPLVFAGEARKLKRALSKVAAGEAFLLQGGDCAESFAEHSRRQHPRLLPRVPADGGGADLCRRLAGGEGRPHCRPVRQAALGADREAGRVELPSYRGDIVNDIAFTAEVALFPIRSAARWPIGSRRRR